MSRRTLLANGLWVSAKYVALSLSGLVLSLGFAHLSTKEVFGQYQYVLSLVAIFSIFSLPGLNTAALRAIANGNRRSVVEAVERSFKASVVAVPLLLSYALYLYLAHQGPLAATVAMASLFFPFFYAPNTWYVYYEGRLIFQPVAIRTVAATVVTVLAVLLGAWWKLGAFWLVLIYFAVSVATTLFFYWEVRRRAIAYKPRQKVPALNFGYGLRVSAQKFVFTLSDSLPPLVVGFFLGHQAIASFQVASLFLGGVAGLIGALAALSLPKFFTEIHSTHQNVFFQNVLIGLVAAAGYWLMVRSAFLPLYGSTYRESYLLALALSPLPFAVSLKTFFVNYFTARERNGQIVMIYLIANAVALIGFALSAHRVSFTFAASLYLYTLNILLFLPFLLLYLLGDVRRSRRIKTD